MKKTIPCVAHLGNYTVSIRNVLSRLGKSFDVVIEHQKNRMMKIMCPIGQHYLPGILTFGFEIDSNKLTTFHVYNRNFEQKFFQIPIDFLEKIFAVTPKESCIIHFQDSPMEIYVERNRKISTLNIPSEIKQNFNRFLACFKTTDENDITKIVLDELISVLER